jgi:hypothetical protein
MYISLAERNIIFVGGRFLNSLRELKYPLSTDGRTRYPQAYKFLKINTSFSHPIKKD